MSKIIGKSGHELLNNLVNGQIKGTIGPVKLQEYKARMYKISAPRFKNARKMVGNTWFKFDKDGYTEVQDTGYTYYDVQHLLRIPGVSEVVDNPKEVVMVKELPATALQEDLSFYMKPEEVVDLPAPVVKKKEIVSKKK